MHSCLPIIIILNRGTEAIPFLVSKCLTHLTLLSGVVVCMSACVSVSIPKPLPLPPPPPPIKFELPLLEVALMFCEGNRPTLKILDLKKRRKDQKNVTNTRLAIARLA